METTNLDKFLHTVRRIEEHREERAVNQLKKLYKRLIKDLQSHLGTVYAKYSDENGLLTYARLHKDALDARLLQEVASKMNDVTQAEKKLITELVEQTYSNVYSGMVQAVDKAVDDRDLVATFAQVQSAKPQALRAAVNNPVHGLTLSAQLEKNRANIIYGIQQAVGIGLSVGDRYDTMAKRVQKALIGDDGTGGSYAKSIRIVRTEAHRVREQGNQDAAKELHNRLEPEGFVMVKTWHTMKDERVRPNISRKTKKGWKYSIGNGKYNHVKMEGQSVPVNEPFTLPSGATAMSPGMSGVAGEDINCRCFVSYEVRKASTNSNDKLQEYRSIDRGEIRNFNIGKIGIASARKIETYPTPVYISDKVNIKPKALYTINKNTETAIKAYGIPLSEKPTIVILHSSEFPDAWGAYNAFTNTVYYTPDMLDNAFIPRKYTEFHEMWHMKQAYDFRKNGYEITESNYAEYIGKLRKKCRKNVEKIGINRYNVKEISDYAERSFAIGKFDEVEAEWYTKKQIGALRLKDGS